jgi:hypothetical protein
MRTLELERSDEFDLLSKHNVINQDNEVRSCLIPVIYFDNAPGMVEPEELEGLIQKRLIISFRRSTGWVRVSGDPIRGKGGKFEGLDRRNR